MRRKLTRLLSAGTANIVIILLGCLMLYPVVWLIMASFKEGTQIFSDPGLLPKYGPSKIM
jgi:ABC-type glycerol-3-phosphate transport system permease component